jgi:hypothetical protein
MALKSRLMFQTTLLLGVTGRRSSGTHHVDTVGLDGRVPVDVAHNLRVVFN